MTQDALDIKPHLFHCILAAVKMALPQLVYIAICPLPETPLLFFFLSHSVKILVFALFALKSEKSPDRALLLRERH
ncbi:hypothetical protein GH140_04900 [bacterium]|nr:hypothetical protein [bacterium]